MMEITFAIIGTTGRKTQEHDDGAALTRQHFDAMCIVAEDLIEQFAENNYPITHLVSGGAAWADHVAVHLFRKPRSQRKFEQLRLYLPAEFESGRFKDNGQDNPSANPGKTANHYHQKFSRDTHINSLTEISSAIREGAEHYYPKGGFYGRNAMVAKSDFLLACTFGEGNKVKDGGTADTVRKYLARVAKEGFFDKSFHYNLTDGKVYEGVVAPPPKSEIESVKRKVGKVTFNQTFITPIPLP